MATTHEQLPEVYEEGRYEPGRGIGYLLGRVRAEMLNALDSELAADAQLGPLEVTAAQLIVVASLAARPDPASASELCKGISYDAGAMTRMLDRLENKGLISRERCPNDRRLVYLALTEQGQELYPRMRELSRRVQNRYLRGFTRDEARELAAYLQRMLENG